VKDVSYYRRLPYARTVALVAEAGGGTYFLASIEELPGVRGSGADPSEALMALQDAFEDYLEAMSSWGKAIPEPELWPSSLGFEAMKIQPAPRRPGGRRDAPSSYTSSSWGVEPKRTKWLDPRESPATAHV